MDISESLAPTSDQLDAIDLRYSGDRTFTVKSVSKGSAEQPVQVHLVEYHLPWRPSKNMRRVLAACWGVDASQWAGHRVTLYDDPKVKFGNEQPGGIRIRAVSHIDGAKTVTLMVTRGKTAQYRVEPLADAGPGLSADAIAAETDTGTLRRWWNEHPDQRTLIEARVAALQTPAPLSDADAADQEFLDGLGA
jgi:hypothetical protein